MNKQLVEMETIEMLDDIWLIHSLYPGWGANESGDILYIAKRKILKPKMTDSGMVFNVSNGHGFRLYQVDKFVFEVFNDIESVDGDIIHIDGDITNNSFLNLKLV